GGNQLRLSQGVTNSEEVGLDGLAAGTYWVRVYGYSGAVNPNYTLTISAPRAPAGDGFEPDDTRATAHDLGTIRGSARSPALSTPSPTDQDWYKFTTTGTGASGHFVHIDFTHALGDLDMKLFDSGGTQIGISQGTTNSEEISLQGLAAGVYFVEVYGYSGAI